jgi:hypothetical protein
MSIRSCPEGTLLLANLAEAMRRQCELTAYPASLYEIALEMDTSEAVQSANRHATDHMTQCPICRTNNGRQPKSTSRSSELESSEIHGDELQT